MAGLEVLVGAVVGVTGVAVREDGVGGCYDVADGGVVLDAVVNMVVGLLSRYLFFRFLCRDLHGFSTGFI